MQVTDMRTILLDFDGVCMMPPKGRPFIHDIADGDPVKGIFGFIKSAQVDGWDVQIWSHRSQFVEGRAAMAEWFALHAPDLDILFPGAQPHCKLKLDDRAITFNGEFPDLINYEEWVPWYRRKKETANVY